MLAERSVFVRGRLPAKAGRMVGPLVLSVLMAVGANAQSTAVLGPRNAAFLEGLWRNNLIDQAEKLGQLVAASNLPDAEKKAVEAVYMRLQVAIKVKSGDALGRRDLVLKQIEEKSAALKAADPKSEASVNLVNELVDQYRALADAMVEALGQEQDPEKLAALRKDAAAKFKAAEEEFTERKATTEKLRSDTVQGSELPFLFSFYSLGKIQYYHSLIHPADSLYSKHQAEIALATLQDFDLDFSDSLAGFESKLTQALCHLRLGSPENALGACDDAIALRERFEKGKDGVYPVDKDAADVIAAAVLQKAMLLKDQKEWGKIVEIGKEYLTTILHPLEAQQGGGVLAAMAEAHMQLGENEAASKEAQQLLELPGGQWARRGQELLAQIVDNGGGGTKGPDINKLLRLAESQASQGDYDLALRLCRQVLTRASASGEDKLAAEAMLITGAVFATRQWFHEASVAFDAVVRRYPKSEYAPDALWRSIQCFIELDDSTHITKFKSWISDRSKQLVHDYPDDPRVGSLQLLEAQRLEKTQKFLDAAKLYEAITAETSITLEARYRAANCYQKHARSLATGGQDKDAEAFTAKSLAGFESVLRDIDSARLAATNPKVKTKFDQLEFGARVALANLFLTGKPKPEEAEKVIAKIELPDNDPQAPVLWSLRIRTRLAQGDVDGAASAMEAQLAKASDPRPLQATCRALATALDNIAVENSKAKQIQQAKKTWSTATTFYLAGSQSASPAETVQIAERLRVIGMIHNNIDENVQSWFEVPGFKVTSAEAWNGALQLYDRLASADSATYKSQIGVARILGFMGRWNDCEGELAKLFAKEKVAAKNRLDPAALTRKPELLTAYLEWGFAMQLATGGEEKARRAHATEVFERVVNSVQVDSKFWWYARFGHMQSLFDRGLYDQADVSMSSLERTNQDFDGDRFGLKARLRSLKLQITDKLPKKPK